jgi:hypothetical protein
VRLDEALDVNAVTSSVAKSHGTEEACQGCCQVVAEVSAEPVGGVSSAYSGSPGDLEKGEKGVV